MTRVDLHLHSTASDGQFSPTRVVQLALEKQVGVISLADHDTLAGVPEALDAARAIEGVTVIPGVEISTDVPGKYEIHAIWSLAGSEAALQENRLALEIDGKSAADQLAAAGGDRVRATGGWDKFDSFKLGRIDLSSGNHQLTFRPAGTLKGEWIRLRSLKLLLIGPK